MCAPFSTFSTFLSRFLLQIIIIHANLVSKANYYWLVNKSRKNFALNSNHFHDFVSICSNSWNQLLCQDFCYVMPVSTVALVVLTVIEEAWWTKNKIKIYTRNNCAPDEHLWKCNPLWMPDSIGSKCFFAQSIILIENNNSKGVKREMVIVHF